MPENLFANNYIHGKLKADSNKPQKWSARLGNVRRCPSWRPNDIYYSELRLTAAACTVAGIPHEVCPLSL